MRLAFYGLAIRDLLDYYNLIYNILTMKTTVYVLLLEQDKYYIGCSYDYKFRIDKHVNGHGSSWTKLYGPLKVIELLHDVDKIVEKDKTLEYMRKYGWQNVRGYCWSKVNLPNPPSEL